MVSPSPAAKFRGCLLGLLIGDSHGDPFELKGPVNPKKLQDYFSGLTLSDEPKHYTDDTEMTICVAESLLAEPNFDAIDLAKRFLAAYMVEETRYNRNYGSAVHSVFAKLQTSECKDPFGPAAEQFGGMGSFGNGAAMRVAPIAIFCYHDHSRLNEMVTKTSRITHSHLLGIHGAVLQCIAVRKCLLSDSTDFNREVFVRELIEEMRGVEGEGGPYTKKLHSILELMNDEPSVRKVAGLLGTDETALGAVPAAIFSFVREQGLGPTPHGPRPNVFTRTVQYAISLGGDTDTIASMAGAMCGALHGDLIIDSQLRHCEGVDYMLYLADRMHQYVMSTKST